MLLPARLRIDDTQAYIRMYCERGNPVSALGVGGNGLWKKIIVAHTLSGLQALCVRRLALYINKKIKKYLLLILNMSSCSKNRKRIKKLLILNITLSNPL